MAEDGGAEWAVPPVLRPYLAAVTGYHLAGGPPGTHRGLPSPHVTGIIAFDPIDIAAHADPSQPPSSYEVLLGGLHDAPVLIRHEGVQHGMQLSFTPLGSRALLGVPAGTLAMIDVSGDSVLGPGVTQLRERLALAAGWPARFSLLEDFLLSRLDSSVSLRPELTRAWSLLRRTGGQVEVARLAAEVGWSARRLNQVFASDVGLSPKQAGRVVRFDRARRLLQDRVRAGGVPDLGRLAAYCGYFDQSHLARDWRQFTGGPATQWLRDEVG